MKNSHRVLSTRHFSWLFKASENFVSLKNIVFLVKDTATKVLSWTQFYHPTLKPIKAYLHGFDITSYLTHRPQLTRYSYYFLNYVYSIGFTIRDVRCYFTGFRRISSAEPDTKLMAARGVRKPYTRTTVTSAAKSSAELAMETPTPLDKSSVGYKLYQKFVDKPGNTTIPVVKCNKKFDDSRTFSSAWKLACSNLLPFKFADSKLELYARLKVEGFGSDVLKQFKTYLDVRFGNFDLYATLQETARQFGYLRLGTNEVQHHLDDGVMKRERIDINNLSTRMFPDEFTLPVSRTKI